MSNFGAIVDKNTDKKGVLIVHEVTDAFAWKTPVAFTGTSGTSFDLGEVSESDPALTSNVQTQKNEAGVPKSFDFDLDLNTTATLMERDAIKIDFLGHYVKNKFWLQYKYCGQVDGKNQELWTVGKIPPAFSIKLPGGSSSLKYQHIGIIPSTTITFTSTQLAALETALGITIYCTGVSIAAGKGYCMKETTIS